MDSLHSPLRKGCVESQKTALFVGACAGPKVSWVVKTEYNETSCAREKGRGFYLEGKGQVRTLCW